MKRANVLLLALGLLLGCGGSSPGTANECKEHIALVSAAELAAEIGQTEAWVVANHKINLWQKMGSHSRGRVVGKLLPGSHALLLGRNSQGYKVRSPLDKSVGWVSHIQVDRTLWQDTSTRKACTP